MNYQKKYLLIKSVSNDCDKLYGYILLEKDAGIWFFASFSYPKISAKVFVFEEEKFKFDFEYLDPLKKRLNVNNFARLGFIIVLDNSLVLTSGFVSQRMINFIEKKLERMHSARGIIHEVVSRVFKEKKVSLYEKIKKPLNELFLHANKDEFLSCTIANSLWVRIESSGQTEVIGKLEKKGMLFLGLGKIVNNVSKTYTENQKILHAQNGEIYAIEFFELEAGQIVNVDLLN